MPYTTAQPTFYLPASEYGKAVPNIPQGYGVPKPQAFFGGKPTYEPFTDLINNERYLKLGRAVGRLDILLDSSRLGPVLTYCTATLITDNHIITNYHCIPGLNPNDTVIDAQLRMEFNSVTDAGEIFTVNVIPVEKDRALDYAILEVEGLPGKKYGVVKLDFREPNPTEPLFIIHHSLGKPKLITRVNCRIIKEPETSSAKPENNSSTPESVVQYNPDIDVKHRCDSQGGSSGALVFAQLDDKIVGLHFAGTDESIPTKKRFNLFKKFAAVNKQSLFLQSLGSDPIKVTQGTLTLTSEPVGAEVYSNDKSLGITPLDIDLSVGTYELLLRLEGHEETKRTVTVEKDITAEVNVKLKPLEEQPEAESEQPKPSDQPPDPASLLVNSTPTGASVWIDGQEYGSTPINFSIKGLTQARAFEIELRLEGYTNYTEEVEINAGESHELNGSLQAFVEILPATTLVEEEPTNVSWTADLEIALTLKSPSKNVNAIVYSPDSRFIAVGMDNNVQIFDSASGNLSQTFFGHKDWVRTLDFSPDGNILASGSFDNTIKLWQVDSGRELATLSGHTSSIRSVAFSPNGSLLASGSFDKTIKLWQVSNQREFTTLIGHEGSIRSIAFSPDGNVLASGSFSKSIKLWNASNGTELNNLTSHKDSVFALAFSPDGDILASGSSDTTIKLWAIGEGKEIATLSGHTDNVRTVAFSPDGKVLASAGSDLTVKLWQISDSKEITTLNGHTGTIASIAFSPDGHYLAVSAGHVDQEGVVTIYSATDDSAVFNLGDEDRE